MAASSIIGISIIFVILIILALGYLFEILPEIGENRMYGNTIIADAKDITNDLFSPLVSHIIPTKAIRFFRKLSFNTPMKLVIKRGSHFVFGFFISKLLSLAWITTKINLYLNKFKKRTKKKSVFCKYSNFGLKNLSFCLTLVKRVLI